MTDYIIVGSGLAGIAFAETALAEGRSVVMYGDDSHNSSMVAGGLYNPVILKRFSGLKDAGIQIQTLRAFYKRLLQKLGTPFEYELPTLRKFHSIEEQNNWFVASDKIMMTDFLSPHILDQQIEGIDAPYGYGQVLQTGHVDTAKLLKHYREYLEGSGMFRAETFDYNAVELTSDGVIYKRIHASHIVFCEGFGIRVNPYFDYLPMNGTKGELLIIKAPGLKLDVILNTNVFILPLGDGLFKAGATYEWEDKTPLPTEAGKTELTERIAQIITCPFEVVGHLAGIRPTVKDRRPLIGTHPKFKSLHVLNGLGTRGVMLGPISALALFNHIEHGDALDTETDIQRFVRLYTFGTDI